MKDKNKLIDAIIDLSLEIKGMRNDMNSQFGELNHRVEKLEKHQIKTNKELGEIRLSFLQFGNTVEGISTHETRIIKLETATFGKENKMVMAKEPKVKYGKKKSKITTRKNDS